MAISSAPPPSKPLLHLGCGVTGRPGAGWLNCDLYPGDNVDCVFDLMQPWPFADGSVHGIYASHVLEHLPKPLWFFREAYRVLEDRSLMRLRVPYGGHRAAWCDPTHLRPWFPESFAFVQPGYNRAIHNPQHDAWDAPFVVQVVEQRVGQPLRRWLRWWPLRRWLGLKVSLLPEAVEELFISLFPVKDEAVRATWALLQPPNAVPVRTVMFAHEWEGRALRPGEPLQLLDLSARRVRPTE